MRDSGQIHSVPVWDLPVRVFHWLLVAVAAASWATGELGKLDLHMLLGKVALTLVLFRLAWGFAGSRTARFADFVKGPRTIIGYLRRPFPVTGHNPLGALSVLALLALLASQAASGLFTSDDIATDGPLTHLVSGKAVSLLSTLHRAGFKALLALVALHVGAIAFYRFVKNDDLVKPMITGRKGVPVGIPGNRGGNPLTALLLAAASAAMVWGGIGWLATP